MAAKYFQPGGQGAMPLRIMRQPFFP
jgi:hypothetical protein